MGTFESAPSAPSAGADDSAGGVSIRASVDYIIYQ